MTIRMSVGKDEVSHLWVHSSTEKTQHEDRFRVPPTTSQHHPCLLSPGIHHLDFNCAERANMVNKRIIICALMHVTGPIRYVGPCLCQPTYLITYLDATPA